MPELPEVETVRRGLAPFIEGRAIVTFKLNRPDLRRAIPKDLAEITTGRKVTSLRRHGKTMIWEIEGGRDLAWHLGMSGSFRVNSGAKKHDHIVINLNDGTEIRFNDPRRFGALDYAKDLPGIDPMTTEFTPSAFAGMLEGRKTPIKAALLDQNLVTGIGNIYACEALFHGDIHPAAPAGAIPKASVKKLHMAIGTVLNEAITSGGSSLRDHVMVNGEAGKFQHHFKVYGRAGKPCSRCGTAIERMKQAGRSTFFCPQCQPA